MSRRTQTVLPLHAADYELLRQLQGALSHYPPTAAIASAYFLGFADLNRDDTQTSL